MKNQQAAHPSLLRSIVVSYFYVALWICLSCSVIIFNKYILDRNLYNWPYPISLTMVHMGFCSAVAFVIIRVLGIAELPSNMTSQVYLTSVVPIGALYALSLWFSNSAYIYLSVSFIQMLKALMPVAVYSIGVGFAKELFKCSTMSNMILITCGVGIAAYGEAKFNVEGVTFQLSAVVVEALRLVLIQILLTSKGISLNPMTSLYYIAPTCFAFLTIPWYFKEYALLSETWKTGEVSISEGDVITFGLNCACAFALNLAVFLLIGKTSALTMNVAGVVKDWLLIAISWSVIKDKVTAINLLGYLLAFAGVCWYNQVKLQEMKAKQAAMPTPDVAASTADEEKGLLGAPRPHIPKP